MRLDLPTLTAQAVPSDTGDSHIDWLHRDTQTTTPPQTAVPQADSPIGWGSIGRTSVGLLIVIGVILVCSAVLKRFGPYKQRGGRSLTVIASQSLGPRERVVVLEVEDTWLVLGVAPNRVNKLHSMPAGERRPADEAADGDRPPRFSEALAENLRRTSARFGRR